MYKRKGRRNNRTRPNKKSQPKPTVPTFASIFGRKEEPENGGGDGGGECDNSNESTRRINIIHMPQARKTITNYTPPMYKRYEYNAWLYAHFDHLLNLRDIFVGNLNTYGNSDFDRKWVMSEHYFDNFCRFVYECSSGYISPNLEGGKLDSYNEFLVKRHEYIE